MEAMCTHRQYRTPRRELFIRQQRIQRVHGWDARAKGLSLKPGENEADQQAYDNADDGIGCEAAAYSSEPVSPSVQVQHVCNRDVGGSNQEREGGCSERIVLPYGFKSKGNRAGIGDSLKEEFAEQGKYKGPWGVGQYNEAQGKEAT